MGIAPRKGLIGRINYWNDLVAADMNDAGVPALLTGTINDVISKNAAFKNEGVWAATDYPTYKALMKKRLKDQLAARQAMIDRMKPEEHKAYRHRVKALADAKELAKERRKAIREAWRANADVGFTKLTAAEYIPDYTVLTNQLLINASTWMLALRISQATCMVVLLRTCSLPTQRVSKTGALGFLLLDLRMAMWLMWD